MQRIDYRQMICTTTHEMLIDWAIVIRDYDSPGHCRSIEHRYKPEELRGDEEEDRRAPDRVVNLHTATTVERVITSPIFPMFNRQFLKAHYLWRARPEAICRHLAVRFRDYEFEWYTSVLIVRNRLALLALRDDGKKIFAISI